MTGGRPADVAVVGVGPAGRALAHRALVAGLRVGVVDPSPTKAWTATYGMYTDDCPPWLAAVAIAASAPSFTVFTPERRVVDRGYVVLDSVRLQESLAIDGATVTTARARQVTATEVVCDDGTVVRARHVVDARGPVAVDLAGLPRQTAAGTVIDSAERDVVLMDWRPVGDHSGPSFSYRVPLGDGRRLVEETCLAGRPPVPVADLAVRNIRRGVESRVDEHVDFPMLVSSRPWRHTPGGAFRFGAAGGMMNPATGYSVAQSLAAADVLVDAIVAGRNPHRALWTGRARLAFRLRRLGLGVLLRLTAEELIMFFDAFFELDPRVQRGYLSARDDAAGVLRAMWSVYRRLPVPLRLRVAGHSIRHICARDA
ncbi:lycopene beta-cyclase [Gordonia malaquae]|uniref:Lycopene beta-cyclase n=1 Tax=Gordonia malaquae NBRC 108250 TaxID=1223542 RepID=M3VEN9_GORML|nr:lycopene cyclase family protein [Gordonia malaquae]GAC79439.1 lycopene beta-cyclase [Gordonia malaquae NBRC 108250]SED26350.1 lycopene beta-cyclase [Gordonia malaquae]